MSKTRKVLLGLLLAGIIAVILLTWGSIGSAAMTLGLLLGLILIAWQKSMDRDVDDFTMDG